MTIGRSRLAVTGVGMVTGLGLDTGAILRRLMAGETAISPVADVFWGQIGHNLAAAIEAAIAARAIIEPVVPPTRGLSQPADTCQSPAN